MGKHPLIGVLSSVSETKLRQFVNRNYFQAIQAAGGMPVLLSIDMPVSWYEEALSAVDGLFIAGGPDVDPAYYG